MAAVDKMRTLCLLFLLNTACVLARKHHLDLNDDRTHYTLTSFGLLKYGTLYVNVTNMIFMQEPEDMTSKLYGFTLDVSNSIGASSYFEDDFNDKCILDEDTAKNKLNKDEAQSIVFFRIDIKNKKLLIERIGDAVSNLIITNETEEAFAKHKIRRDVSHLDHLSDQYLMSNHRIAPRQKREDKPPPAKANQLDLDNTAEASPADNKDKPEGGEATNAETDKSGDTTDTDEDKTKAGEGTKEKTKAGEGTKDKTKSGEITDADTAKEVKTRLLTELPIIQPYEDKAMFSFNFLVAVTEVAQEGMYMLNFHSCSPDPVSYTIDIREVNKDGNYLSASKMPLPHLYFLLCMVYLIMAFIWNTILCKSQEAVYKMHYLMLIVTFVKSLSCLFHAINFHFIQKEGVHEEAWAVLFYIAYLTRGALLFVTIILIGAGWAFIKHVLSEREKKLFLIVIPLQILDNIAWIIVEESEEGESRYRTWKETFILIDLLCCGAILFPVVWSIKHLQDASRADGKEELSLTKLKLFRQFYIMVVCYIYFTRIIVYLLEMTVPFKYEWLHDLFRELATVIFFIVTAYKFRPATDNPYLQVPSEEEDDMEMDTVIVGQSGAMDTLKKVNQGNKEENTGVKLRESSHEYD